MHVLNLVVEAFKVATGLYLNRLTMVAHCALEATRLQGLATQIVAQVIIPRQTKQALVLSEQFMFFEPFFLQDGCT